MGPSDHVPGSEWAHNRYHTENKGAMGNKQIRGMSHPDGLHFDEICPIVENETVKKRYKSSTNILGEGGFSKVLLGTNKETQEQVAMKVTSDRNIEARREVELLNFLGRDCPNIAYLVDCYVYKKKLYMMFEYYQKGDLMDLLLEIDRFNEPQVAKIAKSLCEAVAYCHSKQIAHRDIKGENVLYRGSIEEDSLTIALADFGASTYFESYREIFNQKIGSSCYVAPEVLKEKYYPAKADIWSIGATIFTLLNGEPPFHGPFPDLTMHRVLTTTLVLPLTVTVHSSTCAQNFILSCMTRRVWHRPNCDELLRHAWFEPRPEGESTPEMEIGEPENPAELDDADILNNPDLP